MRLARVLPWARKLNLSRLLGRVASVWDRMGRGFVRRQRLLGRFEMHVVVVGIVRTGRRVMAQLQSEIQGEQC